jgi:hypothetical protein
LLGRTHKVGILFSPPKLDAVAEAQRALNNRRPIGSAEQRALSDLRNLADADDYLAPDDLLKFGESVDGFNDEIEDNVVAGGWYTERPSRTMRRVQIRGGIEIALGVFLAWLGWIIPASGLLVLGIAIAAAGIVTVIVAHVMPAVTMPGAVVRAMLAAYRRTLEKTMAQARSMKQVVDEANLGWLQTPDQAVVWGTALGLQRSIEQVLDRTLDDVRSGAAQPQAAWFPVWYGSPLSGSGSSGAGAVAAGSVFSASALPDFNGMFGVLGSVGNSPSSSGSGGGFGGGGGFSGGSSGSF